MVLRLKQNNANWGISTLGRDYYVNGPFLRLKKKNPSTPKRNKIRNVQRHEDKFAKIKEKLGRGLI